jgi:predicted DNA-binding transcriptional regulator YafY
MANWGPEMSKSSQKRDRTARLLRLQILLWQHPNGLGVEEIARRCLISKRTVYRDLATLESELEVPIWEDGSKRGIAEGYFLPPISFTQAEAVNIFLAVRKMQYFSPQGNSSVASTFMKLNTIVPPFLKRQIQNTIDHLDKLPRDERKTNNFNKLIQAWLSGHAVTIRYQEIYGQEPYDTTIEPYFLEPSARNRANYVIGYCREQKTIRTYVIDRILGEVKVEKDTYVIPADFNIDDYLSSAWGAYADRQIEMVKLRFSKRISKAVKETQFHASEIIEMQKDGSLIATLKINNTGDFHAWIMSWGEDVEVLEPESLRLKMANSVRSLADIYHLKDIWQNNPGKRSTINADKSFEITDTQWKLISSLLPPPLKKGRRRTDDRKIIDGILSVLKSGLKWHEIPRKYGAYSTCHSRLKAWKRQGVWDNIEAVIKLTRSE